MKPITLNTDKGTVTIKSRRNGAGSYFLTVDGVDAVNIHHSWNGEEWRWCVTPCAEASGDDIWHGWTSSENLKRDAMGVAVGSLYTVVMAGWRPTEG